MTGRHASSARWCGPAPAGRIARPLAIAAALLAAHPARAQQAGDAQPTAEGDNVRVFVAGALMPTYVGAADYSVIPAVQVRGTIDGFNFETFSTNLDVDLIRDNDRPIDLQFGPVVGVNLDRTGHLKGRRDARVRALGSRSTAVEVGAFVGIAKTGVITSPYDSIAFSVSWQQDVGGAHRSYIVTPSLEYGTPLSKRTYLDLTISADFVGDKYAAYYFDVSAAGSQASGLPRFTAKGGLQDVGVVLTGLQSLSGDLRRGWSLVAMGGYTRLLGDARRSPVVSIVGSPNQWSAAIGLSYVFK